MEKEKIEDIEMQRTEELWNNLHNQDSEEELVRVFGEVMRKVMLEPNLYYIKKTNNSIIVIKRADQKIIYETEVPAEMEKLLKIGVEE